MLDWIQTHQTALGWLTMASVVTFVGTLIAVPWLVVRIPADYFAHGKRQRIPWADQHPLVRAVLLTGKSALGCVFILVGVALLILPGQGILTILVGIVLLDFPGKYRFERWLVTRRPVLHSINWLRRRAGEFPLKIDG